MKVRVVLSFCLMLLLVACTTGEKITPVATEASNPKGMPTQGAMGAPTSQVAALAVAPTVKPTRFPTAQVAQPTNLPLATEEKATSNVPVLPTLTLMPLNTLPPSVQANTPAFAGTVPSSTPINALAPTLGSLSATNEPSLYFPTAPPTLTPYDDPVTRQGNPTFIDTMDSGANWPLGVDPQKLTSISFQNGYMYLTGIKLYHNGYRLAVLPIIQDFYLEARLQTSACSGDDRYGVVVRSPDPYAAAKGYFFGISCDGKYFFKSWDATIPPSGESVALVSDRYTGAVLRGPNQINRLGVMAIGSTLTLYINGYRQASVIDTRYSAGGFGVFVTPRYTQNLTVQVDQIRMWQNPLP